MNDKLTRKIIKIVALLLIVAGVLMGITHAKYISEVKGNGEMKIAKWSFKVNGQTEETTTINLLDTYDARTLLDGKIAPGTSGSFDLVIDARESDVGVKYTVDFKNQANKPSNLKFKLGNELVDDLEKFEDIFTGVIDANATNKVKTLTVQWEWPYVTGEELEDIEANDIIDTKDGLNALDYTFDVVVTGTQVIPQKVI